MVADLSGILRVAVPVPLLQIFDYLPPPGINAGAVAPGCRVAVPFGRSRRVGIVVEQRRHAEVGIERLRRVAAVLDPEPLLPAELLETLAFTARYYQHPFGEVLQAALPLGLRRAQLAPQTGETVWQRTAVPAAAAPRAGSRVAALYDLLAQGPRAAAELDAQLPGWRGAAAALRRRGLVERALRRLRDPVRQPGVAPPLGAEQQQAVAAIDAGRDAFATWVLEGITGSGKTEVYLALIERAIGRGRQALVLVPEIGLTPQTLRRFRERLPGRIVVLHSALADGERTRAWLAAARGEADVVLGTRSAVFAPLARAGIVVVDEEHDSSYKQQDGLRYCARDLAVVRAKALGIPVVLGSATPALETLANVAAGRYLPLRLGSRPGAARLPSFHCVDLRGRPLGEGLADESLAAIRACLGRGEQALVFRNRRGYAPVLLCHGCGWNAACARCDKPLTWHRGAARLRCHHCGADQRAPEQCPQCGNVNLVPVGLGTERLEQALAAQFPGVPLVRIDRETTRRSNGVDALLARLAPGRAGVLVGTQMLAKGHDLPDLTTVVIVGVDEGLFSVDFRAGERLCQLIVQVAGRAGRALKPGTVWLQTHHPDHPLLRQLLRDGYDAAAQTLLRERSSSALPPFAHLALLRAEAISQPHVEAMLEAALALAAVPAGIDMLGPMPAPMPRRAGKYRAQLLVSALERAPLHAFLSGWLERVRACAAVRRVRWSIDVDPVDLY